MFKKLGIFLFPKRAVRVKILSYFFILIFLTFAFSSKVLADHTPEHKVLQETPPPLVFLLVIFRNILFILTGVVSLGFLAMMIVGGFRLLLAGGDPKALSEAKNVLTFAALGIFLSFSAFLIIVLVSKFTGIPTIGKFNLLTNPDPKVLCLESYTASLKANPPENPPIGGILPILVQICLLTFPPATAP